MAEIIEGTPVVRRRVPWWVWTALVTLGIALGVIGALMLARGTLVVVPDVVGMSQARAEVVLSDTDLRSRLATAVSNGEAAPGTVLAQSPGGGRRATRGTVVQLTVAVEAGPFAMPDVTGVSREVAIHRMQEVGLVPNVTFDARSNAESDTVVGQQPVAGAIVEAGQGVTLVVAGGASPSAVVVPDVEGVQRPAAENSITQRGLGILVVENPDADAPAGVVTMQYPAAGSRTAAGATVAIIVSAGPPEDATTIATPDVEGDALSEAQGLIADAGLGSSTIAVPVAGEAAGTVIAQLPGAGTAVPPGSTIIVVYATSP